MDAGSPEGGATMGLTGEKELLEAAALSLAAGERELFEALTRFAVQRYQAADRAAARIRQRLAEGAPTAELQVEVHAFLRECWDVLDGLGRQINVCLYRRFPGSRLYPPDRLTRQCTFYTVRRGLHASEATCSHPLAALLWEETRAHEHPAYARLSFLYNLALFAPLPLPQGNRFPATDGLPDHLRALVKAQDVAGVSLEAGTREILAWLGDFAGRCYRLMVSTLAGGPTR